MRVAFQLLTAGVNVKFHSGTGQSPPAIGWLAMLHITNGDSAGGTIRQGGIGGVVLPWRDVLHDGPVPAIGSLEDLSRVRAKFLSGRGWRSLAEADAEFATRDGMLGSFAEHEEVVLWFEHDLADQLQLLQLLAWFAERRPLPTRLTLICIGSHPDLPDFRGLGQLTATQMAALFPDRASVTDAQMDLALAAWTGFRSPNPQRIEALAKGRNEALPFLASALTRHLEEFPSVGGGLSRTERQLLQILVQGARTFHSLFQASQALEAVPFLGDWSFWSRIRELATAGEPAIVVEGMPKPLGPFPPHADTGVRIRATEPGKQASQGRTDFIRMNGIDRWLGGVHLEGRTPTWRWDPDWASLVSAGE